MNPDMGDLVASAREWIEGDPDEETRAELQELIDAGAFDELGERMAGTLQFGTAGLRGRVAAGSNRMNRAVVIRATRGVADYLLQQGTSGPVVVGRDARPSSHRFMEDTVAVLAAAGIEVRYFSEPTPTPVVAYAALRLRARAAIVITASHNPPADNGYKVYAANGAQIVPPMDTGIAAAIDAVARATEVDRVDIDGHALVGALGGEIFDAYLEDLEGYRAGPVAIPPLKIAYTPMHGVGGKFVVGALAHAGYVDVYPAVDQFAPSSSPIRRNPEHSTS